MKPLFIFLIATAALAGDKPYLAPFEIGGEPAAHGRIDQLVFDDWKRMGIQPANPASDEVFLRRAYLDAIGTLPAPEEAAKFLADRDPNKRSILIDRLLERSEFGDYWAMKWCDLLRVKSEFPINLWPNAVQAYYHWTRAAIRDNVPYNRLVRAMIIPTVGHYRLPEVTFSRAVESREPQAIAQAVALTFM